MKLFLSLLIMMTSYACNNPPLEKTVFMGDSITSEWFRLRPGYFSGKPFINKGISGQTTAEMLARFRTDVIDERPKAVVILGGTNDIAQNQGPVEIQTIYQNVVSMVEGAKGNSIKVILCSVLPAFDYPWRPGLQPGKKIPELNQMLKKYASDNNIRYVDFFFAMKDERNGLKKGLGRDGVHPVVAGYKVMEPMLDEALKDL